MNEKRMRILATVLAVGATLLLPTAHALALECGDTILPGERVKLEGNVGPCTPATGGITIIGPASLDMNGYAITCLLTPDLYNNPTGLHVKGEKAKIKDGRVVACGQGLELEGAGRHRIVGVEAALSGRDGFLIDSGRNTLKNNVAIQNRRSGFRVMEDRNVLKKNLSTDNQEFGFSIEEGNHRIVGNQAVDDVLGGIFAGTYDGDEPSKYVRNAASALSGSEYDIIGASEACKNIWKKNLFGSANLPCIQ